MTLPEPPRSGWHSFVFKYTPTIFLSEPFQCFLISYGIATCLSILNAVLFKPELPHLYDVLGASVLVIWALSFFVGSVVMGIGLIKVSRASALSTKDRHWELAGLIIIGAAVLLYGIAVPFRLPRSDTYDWGQMIASMIITFSLFAAIFVRATLITSSVFL